MMDEYKTDEVVNIHYYLGVDPLRDYWYADVEKGEWVVHFADGKPTIRKPIREQDYKKKGASDG